MVVVVHAAVHRPMPVSSGAALRAAMLLVAALVVGGLWLFVVAGAPWWTIAGAFACASGVVVGATRQLAAGAGLGFVALVALGIALTAGEPAREASFPAREALAVVPPATAGESARGDTGARSDGRETPRPEGAPAESVTGLRGDTAAAVPADLVRDYYAALDAKDFAAAWTRLEPAVQRGFGGFAQWKAGYATTVGHRIEDLRTGPDGSTTHTLVAIDRTPCGGRTEQRFAITWQLSAAGDVSALTAAKVGGVAPADAC